MKAILKDYLEKKAAPPGIPADYFSNYIVQDNPQAKQIASLMYAGEYDQIDQKMLTPFIQNPVQFFELLSHIPFTSAAHNGETTLHKAREWLLKQAKLRKAQTEAVKTIETDSLIEVFENRSQQGEFRDDIEESAGSVEALAGGEIGGIIGGYRREKESQGRGKQVNTEEILSSLPAGAKEFYDSLCKELVKVIGVEDVEINYFYNENSAAIANAGGKRINWNLDKTLSWIEQIYNLSKDKTKLLAEQQKGQESILWKFIDTLAHESQHLNKFERPGDHTHHSDETIDQGFAARMGKALDAIMWKVDIGGFTKEEKKSFSPNITASTYPSKIIGLAVASVLIVTAGTMINNSEVGIQLIPSVIRDITATGHNVFNASITTSATALSLGWLFQLLFFRESLTTSFNPLQKLTNHSLKKITSIVKAI